MKGGNDMMGEGENQQSKDWESGYLERLRETARESPGLISSVDSNVIYIVTLILILIVMYSRVQIFVGHPCEYVC